MSGGEGNDLLELSHGPRMVVDMRNSAYKHEQEELSVKLQSAVRVLLIWDVE